MEKDPTPGDPERVRSLAKNLQDFSDDVAEGLRLVKGMAGEDVLLQWAGKSADVFAEEFDDVPKNLKKLTKSYGMAGDALADYWPKLERAQSLADKALAKGREAQSDLKSANSRLSEANSWVTRATKESDKYQKDKEKGEGGDKDVPKPDEDKVRQATRNANSANDEKDAAQGDVTAANNALDAAKKMAADARKMREDAAREAKNKLEEASDAGIQNRSWWEEIGDWVSDNWDDIVAACKVVVAVVGIVAMIIGGPILAAVVLIAAAVVLADTLYKYSKGEATLLDVGLAALDMIPGMKGLTTLGGLAKGAKSLAKMGLKGMGKSLVGAAKKAPGAIAEGVKKTREAVADGAKGAYNRAKEMVKGCGDPVDVATGQMYLEQTDITLPSDLPLSFTRRGSSGYRTGRWFGPSWTSTVDQRIEIDPHGVIVVTDDGMLLTYPNPRALGDRVLPTAGPRRPLERLADGEYRITDPVTGHVHDFGPVAYDTGDEEYGEAWLRCITDRNGNTVTIDRAPDDDAPTAVRHSSGYHLALATEGRRVTALSLVGGGDGGSDVTVRRYGYTEEGDLAEIYNSSALPLELGYDERHRIVSWTDSNGSRYDYAYDERDRCVSQGGIAGHLANVFAYDGVDPDWPGATITTVTAAQGAISRFVINDSCQVVAEIDACGNITRTEYDEFHQIVARTDALGHTTRFVLHETGQILDVVYPDSTRTRYAYNDEARPVRVTLPDGSVLSRTYDERGNCVAVTDAEGNTTRRTFDARGRLMSVTDALGGSVRFRRDPAGLPVEVIDPLGHTQTREYDAFGRARVVTDETGARTRLWWTPEGLPARILGSDGSEEAWTYDGEGNCTRHVNANGDATTFAYTHFDRLAVRTGPDQSQHSFTYDSELRLTKVTNAQGFDWSYDYDAAGRLIGEESFDGGRMTYERDAVGRLVRRTNPLGQAVVLNWDSMGRTVSKDIDGVVTTYAYDVVGHMSRAANRACEIVWERDATGQVLTETVNGRTLSISRDVLGRRVGRTTPTGAHADYKYDEAGRRTSLLTSERHMDFSYDETGREVERSIGGVLSLKQQWDSVGRLADLSVTGGDGPVLRRTYGYQADGHLRAVNDVDTGVSSRYELDKGGRITAVHAASWMESYRYDSDGNQTHAQWPGDASDGSACGPRAFAGTRLVRAGAVRYEHDRAGRMVRRRRTRISRKPDVWTYDWDAEDRLRALVTPDGTTWHYVYDPFGRRIAKRRLGADGTAVVEETLFTWDGPVLAEQTTVTDALPHDVTLTWDYSGTRPLTQSERLTDRATQSEIDSRFFAVVTDLVGTPTELVDEHGDRAWRARKTLWGRTAWSSDSTAYSPLRFPGQYDDPESGLHYNCHRYYDPDSGRYATLDPMGLEPAPNPYGYVANPWRQIDPLGLMSCDEDTVVLYHGTRDWAGDGPEFVLGHPSRPYTPDSGVYLTDDFNRAATAYAGPEGHIVRTEVPRSWADTVLREHAGPAGNQPEYFVNTPAGIGELNAGSPRMLPQNEAIMQHFMGNF